MMEPSYIIEASTVEGATSYCRSSSSIKCRLNPVGIRRDVSGNDPYQDFQTLDRDMALDLDQANPN